MRSGGLAVLHDTKFFFVSRVVVRAVFGVARSHPFLELLGVADLGLVMKERFELDGPRLDVFYSVEPGQWKPVATGLDASLLSTDIAGGFIGATFGPYAFRP